ncbi:unnamed protein product [Mytilus coruscus]|uniref:Protein kinase domain-containing protein n=1 Tax=Mytilus coruscus TaxID=42192 RepID=A0A6J8B645_MYTCO|nr:unnamed protein product [Mytilus coruscus]
MDSKPIVLGGTVPFEEEGRGHTVTTERNEEEIESLAGEDRRTFNDTGNDLIHLSNTVECYNEPTDHQIERNTTSEGCTVPVEEEGRGHPFTTEINQEEVERLAGEDRRAFNENGNDSFKLSTTVECDNEPTDHQIECNTTSQDELAQTEGETVVCQASDSNSDKEDNDTKKEGNILVGFTGSITDIFDPDTNVDLRRQTEVIDCEGKKAQFLEMTPTGKPMRGSHSICTVYKNVHTGANIRVVHKRVSNRNKSNYREVLAGMDVPKISPAIFCVIEDDEKQIHMFMELIEPCVSLGGIRLGKKMGKSVAYYVINILSNTVKAIHAKGWSHRDLHEENILLQKTENGIIIRIIDYGNAKELAGIKNGESNMGYDLSMISEAISNLCKSWNEIDDHLLNRFRGDNREVLRKTEDVECLIKETAHETAIFEEQYAMKEHELMKDMFKCVH